MKKASLITGFIILSYFTTFAQQQKISIANENMNIFYIGIDNPVSIAAEGISNRSLIIKTVNGEMINNNGYYTFRPADIGKSEIILYKKVNGKMIEIGRSAFRSRRIPWPIFRIGSGKHILSKEEISAQEYVRAEFVNIDIDLNTPVEEFTVHIFRTDSCFSQTLVNKGNKISGEIRNAFKLLKPNDVLLFDNIIVTMPLDGKIELNTVNIAIK